ncbi:tetratricopeptide repeat protein [Streptomyces sp. ADI91-18]|uniref:tetratricopeptide repeat protein n=1 Tax=Streptomyces sp. ADI91-18 TaxID=1522755 RepID=UPI000F5599BF|nr:tetratricopeptide repeat protein [Streptomyces sp. ADI91-18]
MTDETNVPSSDREPGDPVDAARAARAWFAGLLGAYVAEHGSLSLRALERETRAVGMHQPKSTLSDVLGGRSTPSWATIEAVVVAAHRYSGSPGKPELTPWQRRYQRLDDLLAEGRIGQRSASDALVRNQGRSWPRQFGALPEPAAAFLERPRLHLPDGPGRFLLTGNGGVGKTQAAAAYARSRLAQRDLDLLIWVNASTRDTVVSGFVEAAAELVGARPHLRAEEAATQLPSWLAKARRRWCVVLDDLSSPGDLHGLWPPTTEHGSTLITTRRRIDALDRRCTVVEVIPFSPQESLAYLRGVIDPSAGTDAELNALADDLGHLPLALAQVAAYMGNTGRSCREYRDRFVRRDAKLADLVPEEGEGLIEHRRPLSVAWSLSVEASDALRPQGAARPVMHVLSLLDGTGVPGELFSTPAVLALVSGGTAAAAGPEAAAEDTVHDAVHNLRRYSLLDIDRSSTPADGSGPGALTGGASVRIHVMTQRATRDLLSAPEREDAVAAAAQALLEGWGIADAPARLDRELRSNAFALLRQAGPDLLAPAPHEVLFRMGHSLGDSGQAAAALRHFRWLERTVAERFDPDDAISLGARGHLAWWQAKSGDQAGAASAFKALAEDQARLLAPEHPDLLQTRQSAAVWRGAAGDPAGAAAELRSLYELRIRVMGAAHRDTVSNRNHLANFLAASGDHEGAFALHEEAWQEALERRHPGHRDVLRARAAAMRHRGELGDIAGALEALNDLLAVQLEDDPDSPDTLATRAGIAEWTARRGNPRRAAALLEGVLTDRLRVLGPEHPHTLATRLDVARWLTDAGEYGRATAELYALLPEQIEALGADHPSVAATRAALSRASTQNAAAPTPTDD